MPEQDPILLRVMQDAIARVNAAVTRQGYVNQARAEIHLQLINGDPFLEVIVAKMMMPLLPAATPERREYQLPSAG